MQTWPMCVLILPLSLYTSCSGHLVLSLWVFLSVSSTASIFTDKKCVRALVRRVRLYLHPCGLVGDG